MLTRLEIGMPGQTQKDDSATGVVHAHYQAKSDAGGYQKKLYARHFTANLTRIASSARLFFRQNTLPWRGRNRLLPSKQYMTFISDMGKYKTEFMNAKTEFKNNYTNIIAEAATRQGSMHDPSTYPPMVALDNYFMFEIDIDPVPKGSHLDLKDILMDELEIMREQIDKNNNESFKSATQDLWFRLFDVVKNMQTKMANKNAKAYHKTIITNIEDLLSLLDVLNITKDPELERMGTEVKGKLCLYDINDIKEDENLREDLATEASDLMQGIINATGIDPDIARGKTK